MAGLSKPAAAKVLFRALREATVSAGDRIDAKDLLVTMAFAGDRRR